MVETMLSTCHAANHLQPVFMTSDGFSVSYLPTDVNGTDYFHHFSKLTKTYTYCRLTKW